MNKKEFNSFINEIAEKLNPLNQLLYQSFILIVFYYIFDTISHLQSHKSFIVLIAVICIILDLCIWNNMNQTILFIAILTIYITYNIHKDDTIDTFINTINNIKNNYNDNIKELWKKEELERKNKNEIEKITFIPQNFNKLNSKNKNKNKFNTNTDQSPHPYDKSEININKINVAYKETTPTRRITDTHYSKIMLNELYDTPQYKNIKKNKIDEALDNNIHYKNINSSDNNSDKDNIELFRKPKREFLDDRWLKDTYNNSYNDNCKNNCIDEDSTEAEEKTETKLKNRNKNAICSLVKFGYKLSECTNQDNTITDKQLDTISSNNVVIVN
jgi:hypothetical protein